jgi:hypothetical protein
MTHRQVVVLLVVLLVIPLSFLWTGQQFLSVAKFHVERLEKDRIGTMHDALVLVFESAANQGEMHTSKIATFVAQNPDIERVALFEQQGGEFVPLFEVGAPFERQAYEDVIRLAAVRTDESIIFEESQRGTRHWVGVRAIADENNIAYRFLVTDTSMEALDAFVAGKIRAAYGSLFVIVALILAPSALG